MMARLAWVVVGALVHKLLYMRDEFEDRLEALEAEADARVQCDVVTPGVTRGPQPSGGGYPPQSTD